MIEKHIDASYYIDLSMARQGAHDIQNVVVSAVKLSDNSAYNSLFDNVTFSGKLVNMKLQNGVVGEVYRLDIEVTDAVVGVINKSVQVSVVDYLNATYRLEGEIGQTLTVNFRVSDLVKGSTITGDPLYKSKLLDYNDRQGDVFSFDVDTATQASELATIEFDTADGNHYVFQVHIVIA